MRFLCALVLVACSSSSKPPPNPPDNKPPQGEMCAGSPCNPPAECIDVVGMQPDSAHKECWITCGDKPCPAGMRCDMIYDGPGKVCEPASE